VAHDVHPAVGVPISAIEDVAYSLRREGEAGRRITMVGALRGNGTSLAAITLARALAKDARVVLVDLGAGSAELKAISSDPLAPGLAELIGGGASFGNIITKDKLSPLHLILAGQAAVNAAALLAAPSLATSFAALGRSYDHVVVDSGAMQDMPYDRIAQLAPRAVLVAETLANPATMTARERLLAAGFADVTVLVGAGPGEAAQRAAAA
jgi:Mrp family chromosome partitioning ATPase